MSQLKNSQLNFLRLSQGIPFFLLPPFFFFFFVLLTFSFFFSFSFLFFSLSLIFFFFFFSRYVVYSYRHERPDGRVSFPLIFIYYSPNGVKPDMHMMYASSKTNLVQKLDCASKVTFSFFFISSFFFFLFISICF